MKKILVPTDFSGTANKARDYAGKIANKLNAEVLLLHAWHIPYAGGDVGMLSQMYSLAEENVKVKLLEQEGEFRKSFPGVVVNTKCVAGFAIDAIKSTCMEGSIDLVVMGSTGETGFAGNILGSTSTYAVGSLNIPLIVIPQDADIHLPKKIITAIDLKQSGADEVFNPLKKFGYQLYAYIEFVSVLKNDLNQEEKKEISEQFDKAFDSSYHSFNYLVNEDVEDGILEYIESNNVDLLAVIPHHRSIWDRIMHKSVSKALIKHANIPILILQE